MLEESTGSSWSCCNAVLCIARVWEGVLVRVSFSEGDINSYLTTLCSSRCLNNAFQCKQSVEDEMLTEQKYLSIFVFFSEEKLCCFRSSIQIKFGPDPASYIFDHWSAVKNWETKWWIPDLPHSQLNSEAAARRPKMPGAPAPTQHRQGNRQYFPLRL